MKKKDIKDLLTKGKTLFLAMDQGLEHGPKDFNLQNINPEYVLDIALKGKFNGMILQKGVAQKYYENYIQKVPLIIKLNGKTSLADVDPYSSQTCSVKQAVKMGASAVGYTLYWGSPREAEMIKEFSKIEEEAHDHGVRTIMWSYPRGRFIHNDTSTEILAYAARAALELGADFVKMKYNHDLAGFKWVVKSAGKTRLVVAGGSKLSEEQLFKQAFEVMKAGATGMAIGRNVWQHAKPLAIAESLKKIIFEKYSAKQALGYFKKLAKK